MESVQRRNDMNIIGGSIRFGDFIVSGVYVMKCVED